MNDAWTVQVEDREDGVFGGRTRDDAIDRAMEHVFDAITCGDVALTDTWTVTVYIDPVWCEKAQQFCDDHDHTGKWPRWLTGSAGEVAIEVEVYQVRSDDPDGPLEWREVGADVARREAYFASLKTKASAFGLVFRVARYSAAGVVAEVNVDGYSTCIMLDWPDALNTVSPKSLELFAGARVAIGLSKETKQ